MNASVRALCATVVRVALGATDVHTVECLFAYVNMNRHMPSELVVATLTDTLWQLHTVPAHSSKNVSFV